MNFPLGSQVRRLRMESTLTKIEAVLENHLLSDWRDRRGDIELADLWQKGWE